MDTITIDIIIAAGSALAGSGSTALALRRRRDRKLVDDQPLGIPLRDMDPLIHDAASRWASARGRPDIAPLVASKLRTLYRVRYERPAMPNRRRRWW